MNNIAGPNSDNSSKVFLIDEELLTYESIIFYQREEILKTEAIRKQYTDHLDKQNEALKLYLEEEEELKQMKEKILKYNKSYQNEIFFVDDVQKLSEKNINEVMIIDEPQKIERANSQNSEKSVKHMAKKISTLKITEINNETVYSISTLDDDNIFIGGSNGMLIRYSSKETIIYETNTKEDIIKIEIIKVYDNISLFAFTKEKMIVYKNIEEYQLHKHIDLPGIEDVFRISCLLYIPLKSGILHKIDIFKCQMKDLKLPNNECVSSIATDHNKKDFSLAVLKNGLLYKCEVTNDSINNFEQVKGVQDLRRVLRIVNLGYVYYSDTTIWIVDYNLNELKNEKFENGIKFVEVFGYCLVVIDHDDTLHIYRLINQFFMKLYTQRIQRDIAAVTITWKKVYLSVGNEIFIIKYN